MTKSIVSSVSGIIASLTYFVVANSFVIEREITSSGLIFHKIGWPNPWVIVYSYMEQNNVWQLLFGGNEGILINWLSLIRIVTGCAVVGVAVGLGIRFLFTMLFKSKAVDLNNIGFLHCDR